MSESEQQEAEAQVEQVAVESKMALISVFEGRKLHTRVWTAEPAK